MSTEYDLQFKVQNHPINYHVENAQIISCMPMLIYFTMGSNFVLLTSTTNVYIYLSTYLPTYLSTYLYLYLYLIHSTPLQSNLISSIYHSTGNFSSQISTSLDFCHPPPLPSHLRPPSPATRERCTCNAKSRAFTWGIGD